MGDDYFWGVRNDIIYDFLDDNKQQIDPIQLDNIKKVLEILTIPDKLGEIAVWWIICKGKKLELTVEDEFHEN